MAEADLGDGSVRTSAPLRPTAWNRVTPGVTLRDTGLALTLVFTVLSVALQTVSFELVYKHDRRMWWLPLSIGVACVLTCALGAASLWSLQAVLLGLHGVLAPTTAAVCGVLQIMSAWQLQDRCSLSQLSFPFCDSCACAATNQCTADLISQDRSPRCVTSCRAWTRTLCEEAARYLPLQLVVAASLVCLMAVPAYCSLLLLIRLESVHGNLDNKIQFARTLLSRELSLLSGGHKGTLEQPLLLELLRTLLAYSGSDKDVWLVGQLATVAGLDSRLVLGLARDRDKDPVLDPALPHSRSPSMHPVLAPQRQSRLSTGLDAVDIDTDGATGTLGVADSAQHMQEHGTHTPQQGSAFAQQPAVQAPAAAALDLQEREGSDGGGDGGQGEGEEGVKKAKKKKRTKKSKVHALLALA